MSDRFTKFSPLVGDQVYFDGFECTANSANVFSQPTRALYVGGAGNVEVMMSGYSGSNTVLLFANVASGAILPLRVSALTGNTTATGVVGIF